MKGKLIAKKDRQIGSIDSRIYGSFIEHLGRAVYGGIYEPTHDTADDMGFRQDVMTMVKDLHVPIVRYPGGNFVSGYHWEDGTGPREKRPHKLDLAWGTVETNEIGIDEFQEWAKRAGTEVMMAVNLGTRGAEDAKNVVEYCNSVTDTYYANMRRENGFEEPFAIHTWCLGNEMDGDWQIGTKRPQEYARLACETAKIMKWVDPTIELVACGSSHVGMPTFGEWERTVLRECYEHIDYISLHNYYRNDTDNIEEFLAQSLEMNRFIKTVAGICDEIQKEKNGEKQINLSFDEWNVWFHSNEADKKIERWSIAPPQLEDVYTFEDALVVGCLLITLLKNADRVKMACLAQLVNVIAPIMTRNDGGIWAQTIFYPFYHAANFGTGIALDVTCECDCYQTTNIKDVPYVESVVTMNEQEVTVFAVNRSTTEEIKLDIELEGLEDLTLVEHITMTCDDVKAINTEKEPERVKPESNGVTEKTGDGWTSRLQPLSWNVIRFHK